MPTRVEQILAEWRELERELEDREETARYVGRPWDSPVVDGLAARIELLRDQLREATHPEAEPPDEPPQQLRLPL